MRLGFLVLVGLMSAAPAFADQAVRTGAAAFGDWRTDAPGARRLITPADLPAPFATHSTANLSQHEVRTDAEIPKAPPGFTVDLFVSGLNMPRVLRVAPDGDIFVAETGAGRVRVFRSGGTGAAPAQGEIFADGLQRPYGIAFYPSGANPRFV
jgi:glucose/arabinose dehydrogenase